MMTRQHIREIQIDAPVAEVFRYIEDPEHFIAAMPASHRASLGTVNRTPEGGVSSYQCVYRERGRQLIAVVTREECVAGERIVDRSSAGPVHTLTLAPHDNGTTLTYSWDASKLLKILDALFVHSDKDAEAALATFKSAIEAQE
jgi:uncharacterized protein YndB with AHSA1/START domain